ncbi:MAG: N-acetylmuramoyl-L-alanine amidase [Tannerellaceae bacterium]|nr:N-acetylmuramoyl-L-alanine amidase [Tannerellaceae bacterium]
MNRKFFLHIHILSIFFFLLSGMHIQAQGKKFTVVIDPGHGGRDAGAVGSSSKEKDIVLAVSLKLGKLITDNHPDVKVVYTRSTDTFIPLNQRGTIANNNKGDLFISIHANSVGGNRSAKGTETFTLGLHRTEENLKLAMKENAAILLEDDYKQKYEGFDPSSIDSYIMFEFMQSLYVEQSINFASEIEKEFVRHARRSSRGVKQAGFIVLWQTTMPSVLIELGFISHKEEETFLKSVNGQTKMAESIYNAFKKYKGDYDRKQGIPSVASNGTNSTSPSTVTNTQNITGKIVYKVQILATDKKLPENSKQLKGYKNVDFYQENGLYKYTYGETTELNEIQKIRRQVVKDFKDAFVVKFRDGKKVTN